MTKSLRVAYINHTDNAIISASFEVTSLPVANLKDDDIQQVWRSTSTANQAIWADLGLARPIGVVALINLNVTFVDLQVRMSNSDPTAVSGDLYNADDILTPVDPVWGKLVHFVEPAVTARYVRISLAGLTEVPEAGRLVIGPTWIPSRHFSFGWQPIWRDESRLVYSLGRNPFIDIQERERGYRFSLKGLTTDEVRSQVAELNRLRGIGRDVLVCLDKDSDNAGRDTLWGLMESPALPTQIDRELWEAEFALWERV